MRLSGNPASPAFFFRCRLDEYRRRCNHYRLIVACMLSGASRDRPVIVGWSTALVARSSRNILGNSRRNWQPARACWQGPNHYAPNRARNRVDHRTITERSWDNFGTLEAYMPL